MRTTHGERYIAHDISERSVDRIHRYDDTWVIMFKGGGTLSLSDDGSKLYLPGRRVEAEPKPRRRTGLFRR